MKKRFLTLVWACSFLPCALQAQQLLPYQDKSLTPSQRADDLVSRLTMKEKISLMQNNQPAIPRLGIKPYEWWNEALHGVARAGVATVFPQTIGMAASFDDILLNKVFTAASDEGRAKTRLFREAGSHKRYEGLTYWTPNINIFRDPRWGRGQETYGEDPYLTSLMGQAVVRGLQGPEGSVYDKAHACAKHFAVHSGPEWNRHSFNAENIPARELYETYLTAFKDLVQKANVKEVMCAYNRFEGDPCCGSDRLLTHILREEWGFKGIVTSDCWAVPNFYTKGQHETHATQEEAIAAAVLSGTDIECGSSYAALNKSIDLGLIKESDLDISVKRLMQARFELGEMDESTEWDNIPASVIASKEHKALSLKMAHETITLLQNNNDILPLKPDQTIALIGPNANDSVMQWGNYNGTPTHTITLYEAMKSRIPADKLIYSVGCDRVNKISHTSLWSACQGKGRNGFAVTYYGNRNYQGEPLTTGHSTTPFQKFTYGGTAFSADVPLENFSLVLEGSYYAPDKQDIEFEMLVAGGYELYINKQKVAGKDIVMKEKQVVYTLHTEKGKNYDIEIRFHQTQGIAALVADMGYTRTYNTAALLKQVKNADVVVFAGGISPSLEGEEMKVDAPGFKGGDRTDIQLPQVQRDLIAKLKKAGKKIVFVNYSGSAMGLVPESLNCDAIVQAWYPGEQGGTAVADVLMGDYNPAGRLPITFYKDTLQLPDFQDYTMKGRTYRFMQQKPLFCFGHGLSYTTFTYGEATLKGNTLFVPVTNTGRRDGDEVVQLYVNRPDDAEGPVKTLRGFRRVNIPAGETRTVAFTLDEDTFNWWDNASNTLRPLPGKYILMYGGTSNSDKLKTLEYQY